jgi:glutamyl/glutaminyl-tRNA synthetase
MSTITSATKPLIIVTEKFTKLYEEYGKQLESIENEAALKGDEEGDGKTYTHYKKHQLLADIGLYVDGAYASNDKEQHTLESWIKETAKGEGISEDDVKYNLNIAISKGYISHLWDDTSDYYREFTFKSY